MGRNSKINKKIADEIETMYRNGSTQKGIACELSLPLIYISVILAAREIPINPRIGKPKVKTEYSDGRIARLNNKEEEFFDLILNNPDTNLFTRERDKVIVLERLGINQADIMTYEEIARLHGITRERVRQIVDASIRRAKIAVKRERVNKAIQQQNLSALAEFKNEIGNQPVITDDMEIEYLDLSIRAYCSLARNNIRTIYDLCSKTEIEIFNIRGIGHHTLMEIVSKLNKLGFNLRVA